MQMYLIVSIGYCGGISPAVQPFIGFSAIVSFGHFLDSGQPTPRCEIVPCIGVMFHIVLLKPVFDGQFLRYAVRTLGSQTIMEQVSIRPGKRPDIWQRIGLILLPIKIQKGISREALSLRQKAKPVLYLAVPRIQERWSAALWCYSLRDGFSV